MYNSITLETLKAFEEKKRPEVLTQLLTAIDGKEIITAHDAFNAAREIDTTGFDIAFDLAAKRFIILKTNTYICLSQGTLIEKDLGSLNKLMVFRPTATLENNGFAIYAKDWTDGTSITINTSFDAGDTTGFITITYSNAGADDVAQDVVIRTNSNSTTLIINGPEDTVKHYGEAKEVNIIAIAQDSYHEAGNITNNIIITKGRVVTEATAKSAGIKVSDSAVLAEVAIDVKETEYIPVIVSKAIAEQITIEKATSGLVIDPTSSDVVKVNENTNTSLTVAISGLQGGETVTLLKSVDLGSARLTIEKSCTLNLMGQSIKLSRLDIVRGAEVTITGNGTLLTTSGVMVFDNANLTVENGTFIATSAGCFWVGTDKRAFGTTYTYPEYTYNGTVRIKNATVVAQEGCLNPFNASTLIVDDGNFTSKDNLVIMTNGTTGYGNNTITVNGGVFNGHITTPGYIAGGVYNANNDVIKLNGGVFNIYHGIGICARSGKTIVGPKVVFNIYCDATDENHAGRVGDAMIDISEPHAIVLNPSANYPGGQPTVVNKTAYEVITI